MLLSPEGAKGPRHGRYTEIRRGSSGTEGTQDALKTRSAAPSQGCPAVWLPRRSASCMLLLFYRMPFFLTPGISEPLRALRQGRDRQVQRTGSLRGHVECTLGPVDCWSPPNGETDSVSCDQNSCPRDDRLKDGPSVVWLPLHASSTARIGSDSSRLNGGSQMSQGSSSCLPKTTDHSISQATMRRYGVPRSDRLADSRVSSISTSKKSARGLLWG